MIEKSFENQIPKEPKESKPEQPVEEKKINRREFLKKAAIVGGVVGTGAIIGKYGEKAWNAMKEYDEKERKERTHESKAHIISKEHIDFDSHLDLTQKIPIMKTTPERWRITVSIDDDSSGLPPKDRQDTFYITKEQFDSCNIGDELTVGYEIHGFGSIKSLSVNSIKQFPDNKNK